MPLITICGLPAAGKTTFADGLVAFLRKELPAAAGPSGGSGTGSRRVVLANEEALRIAKREGYRGALV
jgi:tRNA uridine 5-carbamoylmethylation protein Kti12